MLVGQAEHALGGAQPVQGVDRQQLADHLRRRPGRSRRPACGTRSGCACGTRSSPAGSRPVGLLAPRLARVGLDQLAAVEELHHRRGRRGRRAVLPISRHGTEYSVLPTLTWMSGPTLRRRPRARARTGLSATAAARRLGRGEHRGRGGAVQRPARPLPGDLSAPALGLGLHLRQRGELPAPPERVPDIRHRPLDLRLVPRLERPRRVDQAPVVGGQLGVRPVDLRVVQVRLVHPGLEVVRHQPGRHPAEELERRHVRLGPRPLVHRHTGRTNRCREQPAPSRTPTPRRPSRSPGPPSPSCP